VSAFDWYQKKCSKEKAKWRKKKLKIENLEKKKAENLKYV